MSNNRTLKMIYILLFTIFANYAFMLHAMRWKSTNIGDVSTNVLWNELLNDNPREKKIAVIVTSRNVAQWYDLNLDSIFAQKYTNYRLIYIEDCSTDGTADLVESHIKKRKWENRTTLIKNKEWKGQLANHYIAAHLCDDDEIMINVDCDDWLSHRYVLSLINKIYNKNSQVWVTCGASQDVPVTGQVRDPIPESVIAQNTFRESHGISYAWAWWHPRTFYAWLFKQIKLQDLMHESSFKPLNPSPDSAFMYPILEMSGYHTLNIPDILYMWNMRNPQSQYAVDNAKQVVINRLIASWEKYQRLSEPVIHGNKKYLSSTADMILICEGDARELEQALTSFGAFKNLNKLSVIYQPLSEQADAYQNLINKFTEVNFIKYKPEESNFVDFLKSVVSAAQEHIILTDGKRVMSGPVNVNECIRELERTYAHGFYLGLCADKQALATHVPMYAPLSENIGAWQFNFAQQKGKLAYSLATVLYRKSDILNALPLLEQQVELNKFAEAWSKLSENTALVGRKVGLFYR